MSWIAVGVMAATTAMSVHRENEQAKQAKKFNQGQAEITKYSPWTGMRGEVKPYSYDPVGAGMQGAVSGLQLGNNVSGTFNKGATGASPAAPSAGGSPLGGSDYAAKLGQQSNTFASQYPSQPNMTAQGSPTSPTFFDGVSRYDAMKNQNPAFKKYSL